MKKLSLSSELKNCTRPFFRFKSCVCSFPFNTNRVNSSSFSSGLYITSERWRFQHKSTSRFRSFSQLLHQRPSRLTSNFFITGQNNGDSSLRFEVKSLERAQNLDRQRTIGLHIKYP